MGPGEFEGGTDRWSGEGVGRTDGAIRVWAALIMECLGCDIDGVGRVWEECTDRIGRKANLVLQSNNSAYVLEKLEQLRQTKCISCKELMTMTRRYLLLLKE